MLSIKCNEMEMLGSKPVERSERDPKTNTGLPNDGEFNNDIPWPTE